jgi:hypothetical protein
MPDPLTKAQRAFIAINKRGDLPAAVQLARGVLIGGGLLNVGGDDPCAIAAELAGEVQERCTHGAVGWNVHCAHVMAAIAMGIAIGQLTHPDVFTKGGTR